MGLPHECRSDGGGSFRNRFTDLLKGVGIKHVYTSPYNSKSNGGCERAVRSLKDCLKRDWVKRITQEIMDKLTFNSKTSTILATAMLVCLVTTRRPSKYLSSTSSVGTDHSHQQGATTSTGTLDNINLKIIRMDQLLPDKEKDPHPDGPDVTQAEVREMHGVAPEIEANLIHTNPNQLPPRDPHQVEQVIVTTRQLGEYPSPTSGVVADPSTGAHSRGVHGAFPPPLGSSIILITVARACLVLATTRQISQQVSETDHSHQYNHVTCAHHRGAHGATCQTLSCGEDIIIVKCDLIYLTVKGVLEKEDSYDDMHGLSHPSHANDAADQSNNVGNFHLEILKHE